MSIVSCPSLPSTVTATLPCWRCGVLCCADSDKFPVHCRRCAAVVAEEKVKALHTGILDLLRGDGPFRRVKAPARKRALERLAVHLEPDYNAADLADDGSPDPIERALIEQPEDYGNLDLEEFIGRPVPSFA
jgi:hypothetical protein